MITDLVQAAVEAPSAHNTQPWHFYVVRDKAIIKSIHDAGNMQDFVLTAPLIIVVCNKYENDVFSISAVGAAIQNILLCAADLGLGSCWVASFNKDAAKELLKIDDSMQPVAVLPIGYHNNENLKPIRKPIDDTVTYI